MDINSFALGYSAGKKKGGSGGGVELNIAYGDTPPEDTTKIWVKSQKPEKVRVEPLKFSERIDYPLTESLFYTTVSSYAVASIGNKIYRVGRTSGYANKLTVYDTKTGKTENLTNPPVSVANGAALAVIDDNTILLIASTYAYAYYTDTDSWERRGSISGSAVDGRPNCYVNGFIYYFGGKNGYDKEIYKLNTETLEITVFENAFSLGRHSMRCAAIGDKIYLFGGVNNSTSLKGAFCYDTTNDTLSAIKNMPAPRKGHGVCVYGDSILIYGGINNTGSSATTVTFGNSIFYHPSSDTYSGWDATMPKPRTFDSSVMVDGKVYIMPDEAHREIMDTFTILPPVEKDAIAMHHRTDGTKIPIINGETVHIDTNIGGTYMGDKNGVGQPVEALLFKDGEWANI